MLKAYWNFKQLNRELRKKWVGHKACIIVKFGNWTDVEGNLVIKCDLINFESRASK